MSPVSERLTPRVHSTRRKISPALREELQRDPPWMYPWELAPGVTAPIHNTGVIGAHITRRAMIEQPVREMLAAAAGPHATAIDLACNEGWFSHLLLEWGAARVVGVDIRDVNIRRARLIAAEYGIGRDRLDFIEQDVFKLRPEQLGQFDVVLNLGLIYHVENPMGAVRVSRELCRGLCAIESQLTRQNEPLVWGAGEGHASPTESSFAAYVEDDSEHNPLASHTGIMSLVPNAAACLEMARVAGFSEAWQVEPDAASDHRYVSGDRGLFLARV